MLDEEELWVKETHKSHEKLFKPKFQDKTQIKLFAGNMRLIIYVILQV